MRLSVSILISAVALLVVPIAASDSGPAIGGKAPAFEAQDQSGQSHSLQSLLGSKGAVILFYQSADWCPYCKAQLVELEQNREAFAKQGLGVAAISYDSVAILHNFAERRGIHFPLLSDGDSKIIRAFGVLNEAVETSNPFYGAARPGSFVLDSNGVIVAKYFENDFKERYTSASLLLRQFGVMPPSGGTEAHGKQLTASAIASNSTVHGFQRITLAIDIQMNANTHVYAPGVSGYIPIEWKMTDAYLSTPRDITFPKPEVLYLKAIDEKAPVFQDHFRLIRDITLAGDDRLTALLDGSGNFKIGGTLRYQACDDRLCYVPQELPLQWTFHYEPFDSLRVPAELQRKGH